MIDDPDSVDLAADIDALARTMWGEARGLGRDGMTAVGWVVQNRATRPSWWGRDIVEVCEATAQFSCWSPADPNHAKLLAVTAADPVFVMALQIAGSIIAGTTPDPTKGATHYHTVAKPSWADRWPPPWTIGMTETFNDGHHVFYRATVR